MNLTIINIYLVFFNKKSTILNWIVNIVELHRTFITYAKIMSNFNEEKITQCMCHGLKFCFNTHLAATNYFLLFQVTKIFPMNIQYLDVDLISMIDHIQSPSTLSVIFPVF